MTKKNDSTKNPGLTSRTNYHDKLVFFLKPGPHQPQEYHHVSHGWVKIPVSGLLPEPSSNDVVTSPLGTSRVWSKTSDRGDFLEKSSPDVTRTIMVGGELAVTLSFHP
jgi:hypothetical protein